MGYKHFEYGDFLAKSLKQIWHTESGKRYFHAFGLEDLYELNERISSISGFVLLAVDGSESEIEDNQADALNNTAHYAFIVAGPTQSSDQSSITRTCEQCKAIIYQIIARIRHDLPAFSPDELSDNLFKTNGIGPIADNYYGVMVSFAFESPFLTGIDPKFWEV